MYNSFEERRDPWVQAESPEGRSIEDSADARSPETRVPARGLLAYLEKNYSLAATGQPDLKQLTARS